MAGKKKSSKLMDDATFARFCSQVPDLEARYKRIVAVYYKELNSGLKKEYRTPWRQLVMAELPTTLAVDDWLSLVTNYKEKVRKAKKTATKEVPQITQKKTSVIASMMQQLSMF